jgi:hypothetical protein
MYNRLFFMLTDDDVAFQFRSTKILLEATNKLLRYTRSHKTFVAILYNIGSQNGAARNEGVLDR